MLLSKTFKVREMSSEVSRLPHLSMGELAQEILQLEAEGGFSFQAPSFGKIQPQRIKSFCLRRVLIIALRIQERAGMFSM